MRSSMIKTTLREIKNSFGRYIAILAIVALGVAFFVGLMVATPAMVKSGSVYLNDSELFDVRILSTLGFEKDAAALFEKNDAVKAVEGAVSSDFLAVNPEGEIVVMTAQTLLPVQNRVTLMAGRLPETANECVVDADAYGEASIGSVIRIAEENEEDTAGLFACEEYEIVGTALSSYYTHYERGSSALGNGKISGFVYLLPEGFDSSFYTEIFVRLNEDYEIYSGEYKAAIDELKLWAEPLAEKAALQRYDSVLEESEEKIADARKELDRQVADARKELDDAKQQLLDGEAELADGRRQLAEGEKKLADAKEEIARSRKELADGEEELAEGRYQLEDGLVQIEAGKQMLQAAQQKAQVTEQLQTLEEQEAELKKMFPEVEDGERKLADGRQKLADAQRSVGEGELELKENCLKLLEAEEELEQGWKEYEDGVKELEEQTLEAEEKLADAKRQLAKLEEPDIYVLGRDTNMGYASFENDSAIVAGIAKVFPLFFFLVAALVCMTTMTRMVEEQRTQIGVLKALGYSEGRIMGKYLFYSGSAAVIGCTIGFVAGSVVFTVVIWVAYGIMYEMGDVVLIFDGRLAAVSLLVSLLCSMGSTWIACRYELLSVPAQLIRPKAPKGGKRILLERIPFLWRRLSFLVKVSVRNVLRYKRRFFMMVVGIGGCTALLVTGFGIRDSIVDVGRQQYEEIQLYGLGVSLKDGYEEDASEEVRAVLGEAADGYTPVCEKSMDLTGAEATKSATVVIPKNPEEIGKYIDLHTTEGKAVPWPKKGEAVINTKLADKCGVRIGDTVSLRNEDGEKLSVTVTAVCENFIYNYVYISPDTWRADNGSMPEYKSLYVRVPGDTDEQALMEALLACEEVSSASSSEDNLGRVSNMMGSLNYVIFLIVFCAGALAFIVIYNLTNINITERIREIATIKVLGFYPNETASYVFRENIVLTAIGALTGLVLGIFLHRFVMYHVDVGMMTFDVRILPMSYVKSILLTFVFMIIVDLAMYVKLERINMAESLKSVE